VPFSLKSTGMIRKIDDLGRIVLPIELRAVLGIKTKDPLEIFVGEEDATIILVPYRPGCIFCGRMEGLVELRGKKIRRECVGEAKTERTMEEPYGE
jgi:transcriptional pleiotropic regulator of transition state genes